MKLDRSKTAGFSLIEVATALAVTSFCLVSLLGLLSVGLKSNQASIEQTGATGILSEVTSDLRATPPTVPAGAAATSQQFSIPIPAVSATGTTTTSLKFTANGQSSAETGVTDPWRYLVTITYLPNGANTKGATMVEIQASWPASVPVTQAAGSVQTFVALDRN